MASSRPVGVNATSLGQATLMVCAAPTDALASASSAARWRSSGATAALMRSVGRLGTWGSLADMALHCVGLGWAAWLAPLARAAVRTRGPDDGAQPARSPWP